ncbi:restriction endonuclease subunit S [Vibrio cholerae]|nr:restriction endonuclease subunit S [Vibrio cholerae]EJL9424221.1 restriction endonuclease subunit S [Vibrio cholerae]EJN2400221.1 restriction endonuclease subunit S [Vibrio cholerae]EJN3353185.1 restriction endonuclease subunit S [Vibrio cholerae]EKB0632948.1 restriction endonuclease subunit S [Vibrio cholerae]
MSWPLIALKDLVDINIGRTPSRDNADYWGNGTPWLSIRDMNQGKILLKTAEQITPQAFEDTKIGLATKGTVLFSFKLSIGKVGIAGLDMCHNEAIASMPIKKGVDLCEEYLYFALKQLDSSKDTDRAVMGATLNKKKMAELKIPLPPLETQKQIAAVLEKADQLRKDCLQMEQELNSLAQSVFIDMFGDPVTNPKGWKTTSLSAIASIQLGKMLSSKSKQNVNPKKYLRNANIQWREIGTADLLEMDFNEKEIKKFQLQRGDLLVCEGGEIGRCAIWNEQVQDCYYQKALHRVRVNPQLVTPEYLQEYFFWMAKLGGLVNSTNEVTFKHLTAEKMNKLKVPLAPIATQKDFSSIYTSIRRKLDINAEMMIETEASFNSVMQKAFKGELNL